MDYRGKYRTAFFASKWRGVQQWAAWRQANLTAKLPERAKQCAAARSALRAAILKNKVGKFFGKTVPEYIVAATALLQFWNKQTRTRVVSRIIRDLDRSLAIA